jgi:MoxR-like ATPase
MPFDLYKNTEVKQELPPFIPTKKDETYLPSEELQAAVNVALALGQPLLLTGEPGTGKTQLAFHIAKQFGLGEPIVFHAQTSSGKKDLFYHYDALGHFQYVQTRRKEEEKDITDEVIVDRFIRYEGLGKAIKIANTEAKRNVVLIDEIDKSPRDLPNDLLYAIEKLQFNVPELPSNQEWKCPDELPPIIIITSNSEKNLPDAFLRRVVYHHIKFPEDEQRLLEILKSKGTSIDKKLDLQPLVAYFLDIRKMNLGKKPATAELIAWAMLLSKLNFDTKLLSEPTKMSETDKKTLKITFSVLAKSREDLQKLEDQLN